MIVWLKGCTAQTLFGSNLVRFKGCQVQLLSGIVRLKGRPVER